jgi:hypothetical protein
MYGQFITPLLVGSAVFLAACGGGSDGASPIGNAGGLTQLDGNDPVVASGGATVQDARADVSRAADGRIMLDMLSGPMTGSTLLCVDQTMGACLVVGGPATTSGEGTLTHRLAGNFAFAGQFSVLHVSNGVQYRNEHVIHAPLPEANSYNIDLPNGTAVYSGSFAAGAGVVVGGASQGGLANGSAQLIADFNTSILSGSLSGSLNNPANSAVSASFNGLVIDASNGSFAANANTLILFQGQQAWGDVDGAFYGPDAEEVAGSFSFGNPAGGMTGMFLACQASSPCP